MSKLITVEALKFLKLNGADRFNEIPDEKIEQWRDEHADLFGSDSMLTPEEKEIKKLRYHNAALRRQNKRKHDDRINRQNSVAVEHLSKYQFEPVIFSTEEPIAVSDPTYIECSKMLAKGMSAADIMRKTSDKSHSVIGRIVKHIRSYRFTYVDLDGDVVHADSIQELNSLLLAKSLYPRQIRFNYTMNTHDGYLKDERVIVGRLYKQIVLQPIDLMDVNGVIAATNY